jgi:hypothetical protein
MLALSGAQLHQYELHILQPGAGRTHPTGYKGSVEASLGPAHYHPNWTATRPCSAYASLRISTAQGGHHSALKRAAEASPLSSNPRKSVPTQVSFIAKNADLNTLFVTSMILRGKLIKDNARIHHLL